MNVIFGNFGNQTIALMQWAYEYKLPNVYVVSIDTGWANNSWIDRVNEAHEFSRQCGFATVRLKSTLSFYELIQDRKAFPSTKFQWCAGFLKGLTLLQWLDDVDPGCESLILLGKRKIDSRVNFNLPEYIEDNEHYGNRRVWHPLAECNNRYFQQLINDSPIDFLSHRSLECDPCVNCIGSDLLQLEKEVVAKVNRLEIEISNSMFELPIEDMLKKLKMSSISSTNDPPKISELFDMGCGAPYACGE